MYSLSESSSSSSSNSEMNKEFDDLVDDFVFTQIPQTLITQPTQNNDDYVAKRMVERDREKGHTQLFNDYFVDNCVYQDNQFRRIFRMRRPLFCRIMEKVVQGDDYFQQRRNGAGRLGLSPLQKCTATMRMLAYGMVPYAIDEYLRMGQTTARKALHRFCQAVVSQFEIEYLRRPTDEDLRRILYKNHQRGFPGMIGSIDCMHWEWKNCPAAWKPEYAGCSKNTTLILEAVADQDLWIWHAFFGMLGSCNDLNVLYRSGVFDDVLQGRAPPIIFTVNGNTYNYRYYLADEIYPKWATFIQGITHPQVQKDKLFIDKQAAAWKDVERAFGVLQARFAIIREPSLVFNEDILCDIMKACIIMHNIIVEDEQHNYTRADVLRWYYEQDSPQRTAATSTACTSAMVNNNEPFEYNVRRPSNNIDFTTYVQQRVGIRDKETHLSLKRDLVEHIWQNFRYVAEE